MDTGGLDSMMELLAQFGAAGLIGLLWILERRAAAQRDRQLHEAHERLMAEQRDADSLLQVVKENTAAIKSLEYTHRRLLDRQSQKGSSDRASAA